jgi:nicotinate-nucleotide adenylyltransferase
MRLGIFGGTFNPVHNGHLIAAEEVREKMELDRILFIPVAIPPHKVEKDLAQASHRFNMLRLATYGNPHFSVSDIEIQRGGKSYSIDTIAELRKRYREAEFFFILGIDAARDIFTWKDADKFLKLCNLVVVKRPGFLLRGLKNKIPSMQMVSTTPVGISSSNIKKRLREGKPIRYLVPEKVEGYIKRHRLYI